MAEAETLVRVLEGMIAGQTRLGEMIQTVHERAEANDLAIARLVEDHQRAMVRLVENHEQTMSRLVESQGQVMAQALQSVGQALQAIMEALERIVSTTDRTERMTAEILARFAATQGTSH